MPTISESCLSRFYPFHLLLCPLLPWKFMTSSLITALTYLHCPLLASSLLWWPLVPGVHLSDWCLTPCISENRTLLTSLCLAHCPPQKFMVPSCFCKWDDSISWLINILFYVCCILFISPFSNKSVNRLTLALPIVNNSAMSTGTALILFLIFTNLLRILYFEPIHSLLSAFQDPSPPRTSLPAQLCVLSSS